MIGGWLLFIEFLLFARHCRAILWVLSYQANWTTEKTEAQRS